MSFFFLSLENPRQLLDNRVSNILGRRITSKILGPHAAVQSCPHGVLDGLGLVVEVEGVPEEHGDGEDRSDGVDNALAGDVGGGTLRKDGSAFVVGWFREM